VDSNPICVDGGRTKGTRLNRWESGQEETRQLLKKEKGKAVGVVKERGGKETDWPATFLINVSKESAWLRVAVRRKLDRERNGEPCK